jgi:opacity protein-like surface antigen
MNKLSFLGVAGLAWTVAAPAFAADLPMEVKSPVPFAARFTWTGCYGGGHVGGAFERRDATDPAVLIEEGLAPGSSIGTPTTKGPHPPASSMATRRCYCRPRATARSSP